MKEFLSGLALVLFVCLIVGLVVFDISRLEKKKRSLQQQALEEWAVSAGHGEWVPDVESGKPVFQWRAVCGDINE
jgi:hypothetical protein